MIAPTIIIGLGGIGSDICCRVSRQVNDKEQRKRIRFVCIDTDVNDLTRRREEDPRIITIQTSAPYMVSNYLETNTNARDNWFPNHNILMGKTPTEGAGQVRAISRLAFEEAIREGRMRVLEKAIEELYFLDGAAAPQAVRVIIVSTLAGGTGSGIVLPVALSFSGDPLPQKRLRDARLFPAAGDYVRQQEPGGVRQPVLQRLRLHAGARRLYAPGGRRPQRPEVPESEAGAA